MPGDGEAVYATSWLILVRSPWAKDAESSEAYEVDVVKRRDKGRQDWRVVEERTVVR